MKNYRKILVIVSMLFLLFTTYPAMSQPDPQIDGCPDNDPDVPCPIDGGLGFVLIAGVAYGIRRIRQQAS